MLPVAVSISNFSRIDFGVIDKSETILSPAIFSELNFSPTREIAF
jgi:hypothetical protein